MVISDWGGVHDTREAIFKGLDMEFGTWTDGLNWGATNAYGNYYLANPYLELLRRGEVGYRGARRQGPPRATPDLPHGDEQPPTLRVALLAGA